MSMTEPTQTKKEPSKFIEFGKKFVDVYSMRGIGYCLIGIAIAPYFDGAIVRQIISDHKVIPYETLAPIGVGAIFIFIGEFMSNFIQALKDRASNQIDLMTSLAKLSNHIESISETGTKIHKILAQKPYDPKVKF
jgi:hypothetical protein